MKTLLQFLLRFHFIILFILIESIALVLAFQNNDYQQAGAVKTVQNIRGSYNKKVFSLKGYIGLRKTNTELAAENTRLNNILQRAYRSDDIFFYREDDPKHRQHYYMTGATVINNRTNTQHNFLTINKGSEHGIKPGMAVIDNNGAVGVVFDVSKNYSTVISILNTRLIISAKFKKNNYFGSLQWDGRSYRTSILKEIPHHVEVNKGDTICTSGYSTIFPEGIMIGTVKDYSVKGSNFYEIKLQISADFKNLRFVNIISNLKKEEQLELENSFPDD